MNPNPQCLLHATRMTPWNLCPLCSLMVGCLTRCIAGMASWIQVPLLALVISISGIGVLHAASSDYILRSQLYKTSFRRTTYIKATNKKLSPTSYSACYPRIRVCQLLFAIPILSHRSHWNAISISGFSDDRQNWRMIPVQQMSTSLCLRKIQMAYKSCYVILPPF